MRSQASSRSAASSQRAAHSATATSCAGSQYVHDTCGAWARWARLSGVGRVATTPRSDPSLSSQTGCTIRERGRLWRSTVARVHHTTRWAMAMNCSATDIQP
jgi:hypothetical protein